MGIYQRGTSKEVAFRDFAPDLDPTTPGILLDMQGAYPTVKGYQAANAAQTYIASPLVERPTGSAVAYYSDGSSQIWAGGVAHLYRAFGSQFIQVDQQSGTPFGAGKWNFSQFNDDLIAVGGAGIAPQVSTGSVGNFQPLAGNPPVGANIVLAVNGQVMMFVGPQWFVSALATDNNWTPSLQTQAGFGTLYDFPGDVVAAAPLYRNVVAFKNGAMWFGYYVGGQSIWNFQPISDATGTWGQGCVLVLPDSVAFLGSDDFYITTGYTPQRIPNSLKEWFFDTADPDNLQNTQSWYDPYHAIGYWRFVSKNPPVANTPDREVSYNFRAQRWGTDYRTVTSTPVPNTQASLRNGFYFDANNRLQSFTGQAGVGRYRTGWYGMPGKLSQLMRARAKYNTYPQSETLAAYHVNTLGQSAIAGPPTVKGFDDWFNLRQYDRYHQVELRTVGSSLPVELNTQTGAEVVGLDFEFREGGDR